MLTIIVSILVPLLGASFWVLSEQHKLDMKITLLQNRLEWSGVIPVETRELKTAQDVIDLVEHLQEEGKR